MTKLSAEKYNPDVKMTCIITPLSHLMACAEPHSARDALPTHTHMQCAYAGGQHVHGYKSVSSDTTVWKSSL